MLAPIFFYSILFLALVAVPSLLIGGVLLAIEHEHTWWMHLRPMAAPVLGRIGSSRFLRTFTQRHQRLATFIARRLDRQTPWGLSATIAGVFVILGLWIFFGVLQDLIARDPLVILDLRLHNSVPLFRTAGMTWAMLTLTGLGSPIVLWLLALGIAALAAAARKPRVALIFAVGVGVSSALAGLLKTLIGHARPVDPLIFAQAESFPSGHLLISAVVYGLLASLLLGTKVGRSVRALGAVGLVLLVAGVAVSRLYLGVHWPSDLLASLAIAVICLAALLFFLRYPFDDPGAFPRLERRLESVPRRLARISGIVLLLGAVLAAMVLLRMARTLAARQPDPARQVELASLRHEFPPELPRRSEDLLGNPMEPVSLVFIGSEEELTAAFRAAGWTLADAPTPVRVVQEVLAILRNASDPSAPATPAYLADRPQALTFEKPQGVGGSIRTRHHTRVWPTTLCVAPACRALWVATASFDAGIGLSPNHSLPTHYIDPKIDVERRLIAVDLLHAGASDAGEVAVTTPLSGTNAAGDSFQTDGRAALVVLPVAAR
jgi:membrane-associated phospholipid phosphatase